jgi:hypothetical protein
MVHTIGLGAGARADLLQMAAETGRGQYFFAATPADLDAILDAILSSTYAACGVGGVDVEPPRAGSGLPGQTLTYTHTLTNAGGGSLPEVFSISAVSGLWAPGWAPPTATLAIGQSTPVTVWLTIPGGAISGTLDVLTLSVASQLRPSTVFDHVTDTTRVGRLRAAAFGPDRSGGGWVGQTVVYTHSLTNIGNYTDTFALTYTGSLGWPVTLTPTQVTLNMGGSAPVTASVTISHGGLTETTNLLAYALEPGGYGPLMGVVTDTTAFMPATSLYLPVVLKDHKP